MECYPNGRRGAQAAACLSKNIRSYPTWYIGGSSYTEIMPVEKLARLSRYIGKRDQ